MKIIDIFKHFIYSGEKQMGFLNAGIFDGENKIETLEKTAEKFVLGQSIVDIIENVNGDKVTFILSNGLYLEFHSNEGCGGCSNGWYCCDGVIINTELNGNIITNVKIEEPEDSSFGTYSVFIYSNDKRIIQADFSGADNGYYGVGIWAQVVIPEKKLMELSNNIEF